jgi:membrane protein
MRRTVRESWQDAVFGQGGRMAFYQFLAIFPALLMLHWTVHHLPGLPWEVLPALAEATSKILPHDVTETVRSVANDFRHAQLPGWRFLTTFAGVLWAGCNGTWAMIYGLNTAYEVRECRRPQQLAFTIVGLTLALALIIMLALGLVVAAASLRSRLHAPVPLHLLEWLVLILVLLFWFAILYRFAPSLEVKRWQWSTPGAMLAATLWVTATLATRFYFERVNNYHLSFGRLSGVAMLLVWLYATNSAILIGGEMNSEIEKAANHRPEKRDEATAISHAEHSSS